MWRDRHRGTFFGWWLVVTLIRWTGRWPAYAVVTFLAGWFALVAPARRRAVAAFGRRLGKSPLGASWLAVRVFHSFALSLVDRFLLLTRGPEAFVFDRAAASDAYAAVDAGQGLIVLSGHLGNPDLGASAFHGRIPRPVNVLLYAGASDPYIRLIREVAPARAPNVIALNDDQQHASIQAIRALKRGEVVAIKADRVVDDRVAAAPFLGARIAVPTGPLLIAALSGAPVIVLGCFRAGLRRYELVTTPARVLRFDRSQPRDAQLAAWAAELAATFEAWARRYPTQYYQFHDVFLPALPGDGRSDRAPVSGESTAGTAS
ncbi:MAG: lysophospholipid acyltransferase family protein [Myxococcota bacterium]